MRLPRITQPHTAIMLISIRDGRSKFDNHFRATTYNIISPEMYYSTPDVHRVCRDNEMLTLSAKEICHTQKYEKSSMALRKAK